MDEQIRQVSKSLLQHIEKMVNGIEYGTVTIKLQGRNKIVDVLSENRERFDIDDK